jgi:hypothetical protein
LQLVEVRAAAALEVLVEAEVLMVLAVVLLNFLKVTMEAVLEHQLLAVAEALALLVVQEETAVPLLVTQVALERHLQSLVHL